MLVITPHPDDETLGAGGLIASQRARGVSTVVVAVTDGENAYPDAYPGERELGALRCVEQQMALQHLGVAPAEIHRLRLPDSDVAAHEHDLIQRLLPMASSATHIVAPWKGDFHPDHEACGRAAEEVARRTGASLTSYFFWTWHRGSAETLSGLPLRSFALDPRFAAAKARALACHRSQLVREHGEPILPESVLGPARRSFEVYLPS